MKQIFRTENQYNSTHLRRPLSELLKTLYILCWIFVLPHHSPSFEKPPFFDLVAPPNRLLHAQRRPLLALLRRPILLLRLLQSPLLRRSFSPLLRCLFLALLRRPILPLPLLYPNARLACHLAARPFSMTYWPRANLEVPLNVLLTEDQAGLLLANALLLKSRVTEGLGGFRNLVEFVITSRALVVEILILKSHDSSVAQRQLYILTWWTNLTNTLPRRTIFL